MKTIKIQTLITLVLCATIVLTASEAFTDTIDAALNPYIVGYEDGYAAAIKNHSCAKLAPLQGHLK